tara:strand:- start:1504 stop:1848 length:345 start_codon:yes stop_codon:yes gene_type:complete
MKTLQRLINKINAKQNFTYNLTNNRNRYIVSIENIYNGSNPSIKFDLITKVSKIIETTNFDSLGGWFDVDDKTYCLDLNIHLSDLTTALKLAKVNKQTAIFDSKKNLVIYLNNI